MSSARWLGAILASATLSGLTALVPLSAAAEVTPACDDSGGGLLSVTDVPEGSVVDGACDLVGVPVQLGPEAALPLPPPGYEVQIHLDLSSGGSETYSVETDGSGVIDYEHHSEEPDSTEDGYASEAMTAEGEPIAVVEEMAVSTDGCGSDDYGAFSKKVYRNLEFKIGDGAQPAGGSRADTASAFIFAREQWDNEVSPCFAEDRSTVPTFTYGGLTTVETDMFVEGNVTYCRPKSEIDTVSSVDTGAMSTNAVAAACTWTVDHAGDQSIVQGDIRFNINDHDFTETPGADSCPGNPAYDVRSIMTHEFGHILGYTDLYADRNRYQTMNGATPTCTKFARTLGRGDVIGLRARY